MTRSSGDGEGRRERKHEKSQQVLEDAATRMEAGTPWYETLGLHWEETANGGGDVAVGTILAFNVAGGVIDAAKETAFAPVFVALSGLINAVQDAAAAREEIVELVRYCVGISRCLLGTPTVVGDKAPSAMASTLREFEGEMKAVETFFLSYRARSDRRGCCAWCRKIGLSSYYRATVEGHKRKLEGLLSTVIAGFGVHTVAALGRIEDRLADMAPPPLGPLAEIPREAPNFPATYVQRVAEVEAVVDDVVNPQRSALATHCLVGMGGRGKSLIASSVVRNDRVRASFKDGIFWVSVGRREGKDETLLLLERLAIDLARAPTNTPYCCPRRFDGIEEAARHLSMIRTKNDLKCLVVLDNVWGTEVVDVFASTGFHILVTTRRRTVVSPEHIGLCTEVGDMSEVEALEVLRKASGAGGPLPPTEALKVAGECGMLPLALGIAGSSVKDRPLDPVSWRNKHLELKEKHVKFREMENGRLFSTIDASFTYLSKTNREQFQQLGVMASGVTATPAMLAELWQMDPSDVAIWADALVSHCLLEALGDGVGYRLHDLVLEFIVLILKMRSDGALLLREACSRQSRFLSTPKVLHGYSVGGEVISGGLYSLVALWNAMSELLAGCGNSSASTLSAAQYYAESLEAEKANVVPWQEAGELLTLLGSYEGARDMFRHVLDTARQTGAVSEEVGTALNNLASVQQNQGEYEEADTLLSEAIEAADTMPGLDELTLATWVLNRAGVLASQERFEEADVLYRRAIKIEETTVGCDQPTHATALNNWASSLEAQGKFDEAELLCLRAIEMGEKALGPIHPRVAIRLHNLGKVYKGQEKYYQADECFLRAIDIGEKVLGPVHPDLAIWLGSRGTLLHIQGKWAEADEAFLRAIDIGEKTLGLNHRSVAFWLSDHARVLKCQERYDEADSRFVRAIQIGRTCMPGSPRLATFLNNRARLLVAQKKYERADELFMEAIAIEEKTLGPEHPDHAKTLNNRVVLLQAQERYDEAAALCRRTVTIGEKTLGPCHRHLAARLVKLAGILEHQDNYEEAKLILERAVPMLVEAHGEQHEKAKSASDSLDSLIKNIESAGRSSQAG